MTYKKIKKIKNKTYYQIGISSLKHDKRFKAKKPGKRTSRKGRVYYEHRKNRTDMPNSQI